MDSPAKRSVFFLSDRTGITAEVLGNALLSQFDSVTFETRTLPFIDNVDKANNVVQIINTAAKADGASPIVVDTIVQPEIRSIISQSQGIILDFFQTFIGPLEESLKVKSSVTVGKSHSAADFESYNQRIEAINFAMACDDGNGTNHYDKADIILIGVSRSGKTPTSLYLAIQFGIRAANYPFTADDMDHLDLPAALQKHKSKLFGLSIDPEELHSIRTQRRAGSHYASLKQCTLEVNEVEELYRRKGIQFMTSTNRSIEELASKILSKKQLQRHMY